MKLVACVLYQRPDGAILAVSRPNPPLRFGFPGGGVEPGESVAVAAMRELYEETGMIVDPEAFVGRYSRQEPSGVVVTTFRARFVAAPLGAPRSSHEGWATWVEPRILACSGSSAWPDYSRAAMDALGVAVPSCR